MKKNIKINGKLEEVILATENEANELKEQGFVIPENCSGEDRCINGYVWLLLEAPSGEGCQWWKSNVQCNG